jgi:hypothetical protein
VTRELAKDGIDLSFKDLFPDVIHQANHAICDTLGSTVLQELSLR